ncbi:MAG: C10 family peptidase [Bacteroidota bacterium]
MKKQIIVALLFVSFYVQAKQVSEETAFNVAEEFFMVQSNNLNYIINDVYIESVDSVTAFYIFSFSPAGFVIVAADDYVKPILGYSVTGRFNQNKISPQLKAWLKQYSVGIYNEIISEKGQKTVNEEWDKILSGNYKSAKYIVLPLCTTLWEQGCWYNELCPIDTLGPCGHAVTGCVATAMAQVMKFWNYPTKGLGSHTYNSYWYGSLTADFASTTYDWTSMTDVVTSANPAVATLMHHCGVSVDMDYYATSSSSNNYFALTALPDYFKYSNNIQFVYKLNYTDSAWIELMKSEMDAGRPVLYQGGNIMFPVGHAWVCDGYDSNNFLHFNWGDGNTGYYEVGNWIWNDYNEALIKIMPVISCDIAIEDFISPVSATFTAPSAIKVRISNFDTLARTNIPVSYIVDGGSPVTEIISSPIAGLADTIYEFIQTCDFTSNPGHFYDLKIYSDLPCDGYSENDSISVSVENVACVTPPYSTGFENSENLNGWVMQDVNSDGNKWNYGVGGNTQPGCVYYNGGSLQADDWLISKCLQLDANKMYKLSYYYKGTGQYWAQKLSVFIGNQQNITNLNTLLASDTNIVNSVYQKEEIYFTVPVSESYYIGWHCQSNADMLTLVLDDVSIEELIAIDAGLVSTTLPFESCDLQQEYIEVLVKNYCSTVLNNIPISYSIDGGTAVTETITNPIAVGGSLMYTFSTPADFSASATYNIQIYTSLSSDTLYNNDTITTNLTNHASIAPTYTMEFEPAEDFSGWKIYNNNDDNFKWTVLPSGGRTQPYCIRYDYNYNCTLPADDWFVSSCIYMYSGQEYKLSFWYKAESNQWPEKLKVLIGNGQETGALTTQLLDFPNIINTAYENAEIEFYIPSDGLYYIGWYCYSEECMFNLYIDDILIDMVTSNQNNFHNTNFRVFPNPFKDEVIIEHLDIINEDVKYEIYNTSGKLIAQILATDKKVSINTGDLSEGIYILKVSTDKEIIIKKIVKQ